MRLTNARAATVLSMALVAVACSKTLDIGGLETQLENDVNTMLETTGITVDCPDDVKAQSGNVFDCTGTVSTGKAFTIRVTQTDGDGNVVFNLQDAPTAPPSSSA